VNTLVVVSSFAINRTSAKFDFQKYNIEVSIEEIENRVTSNKLKFGLTLLSNPKNVRISVEGIVEISGSETECINALEKDENGIPRVLYIIYQDVFPIIFMNTKVVSVPCPAYRLSQISAPSEIPESEISSKEQLTEKDGKSSFAQMNPEQKGGEAIPETAAAPEQPAAAPEQPAAAPEQPAAAPEQPAAAPEQPAAAPEQPAAAPEQPAAVEKKPEEMSLDELKQLYEKHGTEYQDNPSSDVGEKLQNVSNLIQKRQQEQMVS